MPSHRFNRRVYLTRLAAKDCGVHNILIDSGILPYPTIHAGRILRREDGSPPTTFRSARQFVLFHTASQAIVIGEFEVRAQNKNSLREWYRVRDPRLAGVCVRRRRAIVPRQQRGLHWRYCGTCFRHFSLWYQCFAPL